MVKNSQLEIILIYRNKCHNEHYHDSIKNLTIIIIYLNHCLNKL